MMNQKTRKPFAGTSTRLQGIAGGLAAALLLALPGITLTLPVRALAQEGQPDPTQAQAMEILKRADQIRFPSESFQVDIAITSRNPDQTTEARKYQVMSKGNDKTVISVTEPAAERGQIILMSGRDLWVFLPSVSQPVRLSLAQRLTGQVANGDLARANFSGDYTPKLLRTETIDGESHHVLELNAVDRSVTYQRVLYWVKQKNSYPLKAEFYSVSGRLLKSCKYENFKTMAGKIRPPKLVMDDALRAGAQSILEYDAMKLRDLPDRMFTKEYLKKIE